MTGFCVFTRDSPAHIASLQELRADPSLLSDAGIEDRIPPGFLHCLGHQELSPKDLPRLQESTGTRDIRWSTLLFQGGSLLDFWQKAPANSWVVDRAGAYSGTCDPDLMSYTLKPGEQYVRLWDNEDKWVRRASFPDFGPHHTCGAADEHDPVNFPYFEPYLKEGYGHTRKCYRYFGNGWLEWHPEPDDFRANSFCRLKNLDRDESGLFAARQGHTGLLDIDVKAPYAGVEVNLDLDYRQSGANSRICVYLLDGTRRTNVWERSGPGEGRQTITIPHTQSGLFRYTLRISGHTRGDGSAAFALRRLKTVFQENIFSLPGLYPGQNIVTVKCEADPAACTAQAARNL